MAQISCRGLPSSTTTAAANGSLPLPIIGSARSRAAWPAKSLSSVASMISTGNSPRPRTRWRSRPSAPSLTSVRSPSYRETVEPSSWKTSARLQPSGTVHTGATLRYQDVQSYLFRLSQKPCCPQVAGPSQSPDPENGTAFMPW